MLSKAFGHGRRAAADRGNHASEICYAEPQKSGSGGILPQGRKAGDFPVAVPALAEVAQLRDSTTVFPEEF